MAWGLFPLVLRGCEHEPGEIGSARGDLPGHVGPRPTRHGRALGPHRPEVADRRWHVDAGGRHRRHCTSDTFFGFAVGAALLGVGTAMVYPTLLAAIGDVAAPSWRASAVGVYRLWRDLGYAIGAVIAGVTADLLGLSGALWVVAALTFISGLIVAFRMRETLAANHLTPPGCVC